LAIIVLCVRTAYVNAYGIDNLTSKLYFDLCQRLHGLDSIQDPTYFEEQKNKLDKLLEHIPGEFPEYMALQGLVKTGSGEELTPEEFQGIIDYLLGPTFDIDGAKASMDRRLGTNGTKNKNI